MVRGLEAFCEWATRCSEKNHSSIPLLLATWIPTMGETTQDAVYMLLVQHGYCILLGQYPTRAGYDLPARPQLSFQQTILPDASGL